jgi:hypothetical protein
MEKVIYKSECIENFPKKSGLLASLTLFIIFLSLSLAFPPVSEEEPRTMRTLDQIARERKEYALQNPAWSTTAGAPTADHSVRLSGGLVVSLWLNFENWNLGLKRARVQPGQVEIETIRHYFNVPETATISKLLRQRKRGQTIYAYIITWPHNMKIYPGQAGPWADQYTQLPLLEEDDAKQETGETVYR